MNVILERVLGTILIWLTFREVANEVMPVNVIVFRFLTVVGYLIYSMHCFAIRSDSITLMIFIY